MNSAAEPAKARRPGRTALRVAAYALLLLLLLGAGIVAGLHTPWGMTTTLNLVLRVAHPMRGAELSVAKARGGFLTGLEVYGVRIRRADGALDAMADTLTVRYRLPELTGKPLHIREIVVSGVRVNAVFPWEREPASEDSGGANLAFDRVELRRGSAQLRVRPVGRDSVLELADVALAGSGVRIARSVSFTLDTLTAILRAPAPPPATVRLAAAGQVAAGRIDVRTLRLDGDRTRVSGAGTLALPSPERAGYDGTDFRLAFSPLAGTDIERFLPALGDPGDVSLNLAMRGDASALHTTVSARAERGGFLDLQADVSGPGGPVAVRSEGRLRSLDLGAFLGKDPGQLVTTGGWTANLAGPDARRVSGPISLDLAGTQIRGVALEEAALKGRFDEGRLAYQLGGTAAGFKLQGSGSATPFGAPVAYDFTGNLAIPSVRTARDGPIVVAGIAPIHVEGRASKDAGASGTARVELQPDASLSPLLGPGYLTAALDSGLLSWRAETGAASGNVSAEGDVRLGETPSFHIRNGNLRNVRAALFGGDTTRCEISGRFRADGQGGNVNALRGTASVESLVGRYGPHDIRDGRADLRLESGQARVDLNAIVDGGPVVAWASAPSLAPLRAGKANVTFHDVDLAQLSSGKAPQGRLAGSLNGDLADELLRVAGRLDCVTDAANLGGTVALRAEGWNQQGRELDSLDASADLDFAGSRIRQVTLDRALGRARLSRGHLDAALDLRSGSDSATVVASGRPLDDPREMHASGGVQCGRIGDLLGVDSLRAEARLSFEADGEVPRSGGLAAGRLEGWLRGSGTASHAGADGARVDSMVVEARVESGMAEIRRLGMRGNVLALDGTGRIALPTTARPAAPQASADTTSFHLAGTIGTLEPLAPIFHLNNLSLLQGSFGLSASGPRDATRLAGYTRLAHPHVNDVWADSVAVDVSGVAHDAQLANLEAKVAARSLVAWPLASRDLDAALDWDGREARADLRSVLPGDRHEDLAFRVEPIESGVRGRIESFAGTWPGGSVMLQSPVDFELGKRISLSEMVVLDGGKPMLQARGSATEDGALDFEMHVDSLSLDRFHDALASFPLRGSVSMDGAMTGTRTRPAIDASLKGWLVSGGREPAALNGKVRWADGLLDFSTRFDQTHDNWLTADARLPLTLSLAPDSTVRRVTVTGDSMEAKLEAKNFDLSWFQSLISPRNARGVEGKIYGLVTAKGNVESPKLAGRLAFKEGQVELPHLGIKLEDGLATFAFHDRTIQLEHASLKSGGTLVASGAATLEGRGHRPVNIEVNLRRFVPVNNSTAKAQVDGRIAVSGTLDKPRVGCDLTLQKSTIYAERGEGSKLEQVDLTQRDYADLQERFGVGVGGRPAERRTLADSVDLDARIKTGDNVWVRRHSDPIVALELKGDIQARRPPGGALSARGTLGIRTGRSYMSFLGRRFEMKSAQVELPGPVDSASAHLEAFYNASSSGSGSADVDVTALVEIEPSGVTTTLRSEPYLDQASLLNYLATGEVQGGLGSGSAYGLAVGSALGAVGGAAGRSLGLDVVEVTTDAYGGQNLGAGSYVNPRVYLGFRQPVVEGKRTGNASTSSSSNTEFEVEVEAVRNLLLNIQGSSAQYRFVLRPRLGR